MRTAVPRATLALVVLLGLAGCSSDDGPGDLGDSCSAPEECVDGLSCKNERCLGDTVVPGQVFFPQQNQPDSELHVALFYDGDPGSGDPLVPSRAPLERSFAAPVSYPVSFQFSGVPAGEFDIVAFVPLPEGRAARGQVAVSIGDRGDLAVNGVPRASVSISITGESLLDE